MKKDMIVEVATTQAVEVVKPKTMMVDDIQETNLMQQMDLGSYYSIQPTTKAEKLALYNALNNPQERLADHINMTINVKDVLVEIVELEQEATGELVKCPRIILIDDKGTSFQCVSVGVFSGLKKIMKLFGEPTWDEPIAMRIKQVAKKEKKMLTIELV